MPTDREEALDVFVSYAHEDEVLCAELRKHLSILEREGKIRSWHDRAIAPGEAWQGEIDHRLNAADVILLLVSPDFMASEYCFDVELPRALERQKAGGAHVVPILLRPVDWSRAPFAKLQILPRDAVPVTSWSDRDEAFVNVQQGVRAAIEREQQRRRQQRPEPPRPEPSKRPESPRPEPPRPEPSKRPEPLKLPASLTRRPWIWGLAALAAVALAAAVGWMSGDEPGRGYIAIRAPYDNVTRPGRAPIAGDVLRIDGSVGVYEVTDNSSKKIGRWRGGTQVRVVQSVVGNVEGGRWLECRKTE